MVTPLLPLVPLLLGQCGDTIAAGGLHDLAGDNDGRLTDTLDTGIYQAVADLVGVERVGQSGGRGVDHIVGDPGGLGQNGSETDTGENIHYGLSLVKSSVPMNEVEQTYHCCPG